MWQILGSGGLFASPIGEQPQKGQSWIGLTLSCIMLKSIQIENLRCLHRIFSHSSTLFMKITIGPQKTIVINYEQQRCFVRKRFSNLFHHFQWQLLPINLLSRKKSMLLFSWNDMTMKTWYGKSPFLFTWCYLNHFSSYPHKIFLLNEKLVQNFYISLWDSSKVL